MLCSMTLPLKILRLHFFEITRRNLPVGYNTSLLQSLHSTSRPFIGTGSTQNLPNLPTPEYYTEAANGQWRNWWKHSRHLLTIELHERYIFSRGAELLNENIKSPTQNTLLVLYVCLVGRVFGASLHALFEYNSPLELLLIAFWDALDSAGIPSGPISLLVVEGIAGRISPLQVGVNWGKRFRSWFLWLYVGPSGRNVTRESLMASLVCLGNW